MMETRHDRVLRKLEGQDVRGKHTAGIIEILTHHNLGASDYFIPSTYKDESGKENKCYKVTKLGCDFLANKFNGEKGIVFTARYVKRFNDMEKAIKKPQAALPKMMTYLQIVTFQNSNWTHHAERGSEKIIGN